MSVKITLSIPKQLPDEIIEQIKADIAELLKQQYLLLPNRTNLYVVETWERNTAETGKLYDIR